MSKHSKIKGIHDKIISNLERIVHDEISERNMEYSNQHRVIGEIDYWTYNTNSEILRLFEVKSNISPKNINKGLKQLSRHINILVPEYFEYTPRRIFTYLVSGCKYDKYWPRIIYVSDAHRCSVSNFFSRKGNIL